MACFNRVKEDGKYAARTDPKVLPVRYLNMIQSRDERMQSLPHNVVFFVDIKQMEHKLCHLYMTLQQCFRFVLVHTVYFSRANVRNIGYLYEEFNIFGILY